MNRGQIICVVFEKINPRGTREIIYKNYIIMKTLMDIYVAYKPITLSCILFTFIEMKFIHYHSCVMFAMNMQSNQK